VFDRITSGTTGEPSLVKLTSFHFYRNKLENMRLSASRGLGRLKPMLQIKQPSPYNHEGTETAATNTHHILYTNFASKMKRKIEELRPQQLRIFPPLLEELLESDADLLSLKAISTVGSVLREQTREAVARLGTCNLYDDYGSKETGIIAKTCGRCGQYHFANETMLCEFLSDDGTAVVGQGTAHLILTPYFNQAMPLLRYELGDLVEISEAEKHCSTEGTSARRILGRRISRFHLPDGRKIMPKFSSDRAHALGLRQIKLFQTSYCEVEVRYVPDSPNRIVRVEDLQAVVDISVSPLLKVVPVRMENIPSAPGKYIEHESVFERA
jgi:phenylacetate-CoA ligase